MNTVKTWIDSFSVQMVPQILANQKTKPISEKRIYHIIPLKEEKKPQTGSKEKNITAFFSLPRRQVCAAAPKDFWAENCTRYISMFSPSEKVEGLRLD